MSPSSDAPATTPPSPWIERFLPLLAPGSTVLDLACGAGRHARLAAGAGHRVTAVDRDLSGVADLAGAPGVELLAADLEDGAPWPLGARRFAAVIVTNYLWRPLLPAILAAVDDGGLLLYETFARGNERFGKPRNPDFLLRPGELLQAFGAALQVIAFEQGEVETPRHAVVQRIAAARATEPRPLRG